MDQCLPSIDEIEDKNLKKIQNLNFEVDTVNVGDEPNSNNKDPPSNRQKSFSSLSEEDQRNNILNLSLSKHKADNHSNNLIESPRKSAPSSGEVINSSITSSGSKISLSLSENTMRLNKFEKINIEIPKNVPVKEVNKIGKSGLNKFEETMIEEEVLQNKNIQVTRCTKKISDLSYGGN